MSEGFNLLRNVLAIKRAVSIIKGSGNDKTETKGKVQQPITKSDPLVKAVENVVEVTQQRKMPRLLIIGHGRHGKDTLAKIFAREYDMTFQASSMAASEIFIYDVLKDKYGYRNSVECFEDRSNHRAEWYDLICWYNKNDKARLAKEIMSRSNCYVGMRDEAEIKECLNQGVFDLVIWVDASNRLPKEPKDSFNISTKSADILISNNGKPEDFEIKAARLGKMLFT